MNDLLNTGKNMVQPPPLDQAVARYDPRVSKAATSGQSGKAI
jgi:hypothetical protein